MSEYTVALYSHDVKDVWVLFCAITLIRMDMVHSRYSLSLEEGMLTHSTIVA